MREAGSEIRRFAPQPSGSGSPARVPFWPAARAHKSDIEPDASRSWRVRRQAPVGAQKVCQRLTVAAARCIDSAKRRTATRSEAETAICRPQLAVSGIQKVGRGRRVSRVRFSPIRISSFEHGATYNDTPRHDAAGY